MSLSVPRKKALLFLGIISFSSIFSKMLLTVKRNMSWPATTMRPWTIGNQRWNLMYGLREGEMVQTMLIMKYPADASTAPWTILLTSFADENLTTPRYVLSVMEVVE